MEPEETPDMMYGRLREAVYVSSTTFERAMDELKWLLAEGRWTEVGQGYQDIDSFMRSVDFSAFNMENRAEMVRMLKDLSGASNRAIAEAIGVSNQTVNRDLRNGTNVPPETEMGSLDHDLVEPTGTNVPPEEDEKEVMESDELGVDPPSLELLLDDTDEEDNGYEETNKAEESTNLDFQSNGSSNASVSPEMDEDADTLTQLQQLTLEPRQEPTIEIEHKSDQQTITNNWLTTLNDVEDTLRRDLDRLKIIFESISREGGFEHLTERWRPTDTLAFCHSMENFAEEMAQVARTLAKQIGTPYDTPTTENTARQRS